MKDAGAYSRDMDAIAPRPHRGGLVLGFGAAGMFIWILLIPALSAWVLGAKELKAMNSGVSDPAGRTITQIGMVLGIVGTAIWILAAVMAIVVFGTDAGPGPTVTNTF
jgi:hypothetical protein